MPNMLISPDELVGGWYRLGMMGISSVARVLVDEDMAAKEGRGPEDNDDDEPGGRTNHMRAARASSPDLRSNRTRSTVASAGHLAQDDKCVPCAFPLQDS